MEDEYICGVLTELMSCVYDIHAAGQNLTKEFVKKNPDWEEYDTHGVIDFFIKDLRI